jgi:predicted nucleic acid-binding protein
VEGEADYLMTGDQHLLKLDVFQGVQVVTPREFLESAGI